MRNSNDGQTIYFHPECVLDWNHRLLRYALELKYTYHSCQRQSTGKGESCVSYP